MAVKYTYHGERPREGNSWLIDVIGPQVGVAVAVADSAASSALTLRGLYRIAATSASLVNINSSATNGTNGEYWPSGQVEVRLLDVGDKIGVSAG